MAPCFGSGRGLRSFTASRVKGGSSPVRAWFAPFDAETLVRRIEEDVQAGRRYALVDEA